MPLYIYCEQESYIYCISIYHRCNKVQTRSYTLHSPPHANDASILLLRPFFASVDPRPLIRVRIPLRVRLRNDLRLVDGELSFLVRSVNLN